MPHTIYGWASAGACGLVALYACLRGRGPERAAAAVLLGALAAVCLLQDRQHWVDPRMSMLAVDGAMLIVFSIFVVSWRRIWLLFATAFQLLTTAEHFAAIGHHLPKASLSLQAALTYGVMASLAWGVWRVDRDVRRHREPVPAA